MIDQTRIALRVFKLIARAACLISLLVLATHLEMLTTHANPGGRFSCIIGDDGNGNITVVSYGSSAGNFFYNCNSNGCTMMQDNPLNQETADHLCEDYGAHGCPGNLFSE